MSTRYNIPLHKSAAVLVMFTLITTTTIIPSVSGLRSDCPANLMPNFEVTERSLPAEWLNSIVSLFPEGKKFTSLDHPLGPTALASSVTSSMRFKQRSNIKITFVHEGAGYRNQFGIYDVDSQEETLIFPDLSFYSPGCMESGDSVTLGPFEAGSHIGWFLKADGFRRDTLPTYFSDESRNVDGKQHVVTVLDEAFQVLLVGIEDLLNLGDVDFNDALFFAEVIPAPENGVAAESIPPASGIEDLIDTTSMVTTSAGQSVECRDAQIGSMTAETNPTQLALTETGFEYALNDAGLLNEVRLSGHTRPWKIPVETGWIHAADHPALRSIVPFSTWGTTCLAFADDVGVTPTLAHCEVTTEIGANGNNCLTTSTQSSKAIVSRSRLDGKLPAVDVAQAQSFGAGYETATEVDTADGGAASSVFVVDETVASSSEAGVRIPVLGPLEPELHKFGFSVCTEVAASGNGIPEGSPRNASLHLAVDVFFADDTPPILGRATKANPSAHDWESVCLDIPPFSVTSVVDHIGIHGISRGIDGESKFRNFKVLQRDGNRIINPNGLVAGRTDIEPPQKAEAWNSFGSGYTLEADAICMVATSEAEVHGAEQINVFDPPVVASSIYIGADARAFAVSGLADRFAAVYADVTYADGSQQFGIHVPLPTGTGDSFKMYDAVVNLENSNGAGGSKAVSKVNLVLTFAGHSGKMCARNVQLRLFSSSGNGGSSAGAPRAEGDPHYRTISGSSFDLQTVGEFTAYADDEAELQIRHSAAGDAAVASAIAFRFRGTRIMIERGDGKALPSVKINGALVSIGDGESAMALPADDGAVSGTQVTRNGVTVGSERNLNGIPLTYRIVAQSQAYPGEIYAINIEVFLSEYKVQYLSVLLTDFPRNAAVTASGLFAVTNADLGDGTNRLSRTKKMVSRKHQRRIDIQSAIASTIEVSHRVIGPRFAVSTRSTAFSYPKGITADTVSDPASAERFIKIATGADFAKRTEEAMRDNGPCAAVQDERARMNCAQDIVLSGGDSGFATAHVVNDKGMDTSINGDDVTQFIDSAVKNPDYSFAVIDENSTSSASRLQLGLSILHLIVTVALALVML